MTSVSVVGIGASAGGLEALHSLFAAMPADSGFAFVVLLHLPANRKSMLAEILARWTAMPAIEVEVDTPVEANRIYVPVPHLNIALKDGKLCVQAQNLEDGRVGRPIDSFFDSLAISLREQAIGIVLSGSGSDGALGLRSIKEAGGVTIVQGSNGTAPQYTEMPTAAIATGAVDVIAPIEDMPRQLMRMRDENTAPPAAPAEESPADAEAARLTICGLLRARTGHDLSGYRDGTFMRRVRRRMQMISATTLQDYVRRVQQDPQEASLLFRDLLIRVTSFFRDKETFEILSTKIVPRLFADKHADSAVRVWVPGCATGEEAYSLAILLREHLDSVSNAPRVQIFATDIDDTAIAIARVGRYPASLLDGLSQERRTRFFVANDGGYSASKELRELCTFSAHNLVRDPPFSRLNLISCRNLLIYMDVRLQENIIPRFHYALAPGGILLLGASESAARHEQLFSPLDKGARIYQRRDVQSPPLNLDLAISTMGLLQRAGRVQPFGSAGAAAGASGSPVALPKEPAKGRISFLRRIFGSGSSAGDTELSRAHKDLQASADDYQTAVEELRSSNEELHSVNEELQSTNEELETSKEELQSLNEELHTVNTRLSEKVEELAQSNSDLRNLFESTDVATIFLDRHLVIRSFTPAVTTLYSLIPADQGRPILDIVSELDYDNLHEDVATVLQQLRPLERRVARKDRTMHYIMRIRPYREPDNTVSGALVTFVDVTSIVLAEERLRDADLRKDIFLATLSHELRNPLAPIRTASRLLESPKLAAADLVRAQAIIARQVAHMSSLLDDLLDVSRITRGSFLLKRQRVEVRVLFEAAVEAAQPTMDAKRHTLRVELPKAPVYLDADPLRITQVIGNLLNNAAKYTPAEGVIKLRAHLEGEELTVVVRDNGIGIEPGMLAQIFNMFIRVESDTGRVEGGLGIGLALAKGLVELHGGRIEARSGGLGQGSEFVVSLPRALIVQPRDGVIAGSDGHMLMKSPRRVLIADDNQDGAHTLSMFLQLAGHQTHIANSGTQALQLAEQLRPEIVVLDIGMPDLSGYDVARHIRSQVWGAQMMLIATTGWGQEEDKRRAVTAGFDRHFTKPVDPDELERSFNSADRH